MMTGKEYAGSLSAIASDILYSIVRNGISKAQGKDGFDYETELRQVVELIASAYDKGYSAGYEGGHSDGYNSTYLDNFKRGEVYD